MTRFFGPGPGVSTCQKALDQLEALLKDRISTAGDVLLQHANTLTWIEGQAPGAVCWPTSTQEVASIVGICAAHNVPIIPFGAGTSLEGHVNAPLGGVCLDLSRMDQICSVNVRDMDCTVQAGVTLGQLKRHLRDTGLFFSVDPGAEEATLGGMAATRASGTRTVRYGTMRDNVLSMIVVMADGRIVKTGSRARKSAAGYDLTRLIIGSEGTLGIITELTLRLHPVPEAVHTALATFAGTTQACEAAISTIQHGLAVARIELLDMSALAAGINTADAALPSAPALLVEFHGTTDGLKSELELFSSIAREHGAAEVELAEDEDKRRQLWRARHDAFWAIKNAWPGKANLVTDVCVPLARLAECVSETQADSRRSGLIAPILGHVGDGNFHAIVVFDAADAQQLQTVRGFVERLSERALAMEGTCTGEHGIGQGKIAALEREAGDAIDVMRAVKTALDPAGLLNPGKILRRLPNS